MEIRLRAVFFEGLLFLLWSFICFVNSGLFRFSFLLSGLGILFGLAFGAAVALKYISSLEKNGEFRTTIKMLALALVTIIILVPIAFYLLFTFGLETAVQMASFIYTFIPAFYLARIILYLDWERKKAKVILLGLTRTYAAPKNIEKGTGSLQ